MGWSLLFITVFVTLLYSESSHGLGINCRGSSECNTTGNNLNELVNTVCNNTPGGNIYGPGVRIATNCHILGGIAAFTQDTKASISASDACTKLRQLQDHGCKICGSIPLNPGNNVKQGQLTVNYVGQCG